MRRAPNREGKLRELIADNPEQSATLAALAGFAWGGGLSNWLARRLTFAAIETLVGDQMVAAMTSGKGYERRRN
jgi:hypothetical protein